MLKNILIVFILMFITTNVYASKQEWKDKNFVFNKADNILIELNFFGENNGIYENEVFEIYEEKSRKNFDKLREQNYKIYNANEIKKLIEDKQITEDYSTYIKNNIDLLLSIDILKYDIGSEYVNGYTYTVPTVRTSYVTNYNDFSTSTVTTYVNEEKYVPGKNIEVSNCCVKFTVYDVKSGKKVWTLIDNRTAEYSDEPKNPYGRIIKSYSSEFQKILDRDKE